MVSKSLMVLLVVALVSKDLHVLAAPAPEPAPEPNPMLGYLMWSTGVAHGLVSGAGLYGLVDMIKHDNGKQPMIVLMPQGGSIPMQIALRRNGNADSSAAAATPVQLVPVKVASAVQTSG